MEDGNVLSTKFLRFSGAVLTGPTRPVCISAGVSANVTFIDLCTYLDFVKIFRMQKYP